MRSVTKYLVLKSTRFLCDRRRILNGHQRYRARLARARSSSWNKGITASKKRQEKREKRQEIDLSLRGEAHGCSGYQLYGKLAQWSMEPAKLHHRFLTFQFTKSKYPISNYPISNSPKASRKISTSRQKSITNELIDTHRTGLYVTIIPSQLLLRNSLI